MEKYHLFAGDSYYPGGGMFDYLGAFDSVDEAKAAFANAPADWGQIAMTKEDGSLVLKWQYEYWEWSQGPQGRRQRATPEWRERKERE